APGGVRGLQRRVPQAGRPDGRGDRRAAGLLGVGPDQLHRADGLVHRHEGAAAAGAAHPDVDRRGERAGAAPGGGARRRLDGRLPDGRRHRRSGQTPAGRPARTGVHPVDPDRRRRPLRGSRRPAPGARQPGRARHHPRADRPGAAGARRLAGVGRDAVGRVRRLPGGGPGVKNFPWTTMPTVWFQIAWSDELKPGEIRPMRYFNRDLIAYRGASGQVHVLDAYCAHLGAHLGYGGTVVDDDIICPFHHWRWSCEGCTVDIPYSARKTQAKRIGTWPVRELEPYVFVWHDLAGAPPSWEPEKVPLT